MSDFLIWGLLALGLVLLVFFIGLVLPRRTVSRWVVRYRKPKDLIWSLVTDHGRESTWRPELVRCERLPDQGGKPAWREHRKKGEPVTLVTRESDERSGRLIRASQAEDGGGSSWTFDLQAAEGGCSLSITEEVENRSVLKRLAWHGMMRKGTAVKAYIALLSTRLGENVTPKAG